MCFTYSKKHSIVFQPLLAAAAPQPSGSVSRNFFGYSIPIRTEDEKGRQNLSVCTDGKYDGRMVMDRQMVKYCIFPCLSFADVNVIHPICCNYLFET
jgi:hypothetical protein